MNRQFAIGFKSDPTLRRVLVQYGTKEAHLAWIEARRNSPRGDDLVLLEKVAGKWTVVS